MIILYVCLSCIAEDEREFSYDENSEIGPAHWGDLHEEWKECGEGKMQSPIDMVNQRVEIVSHLGRLKRSYKPSNATLINRGHDVMVPITNIIPFHDDQIYILG